MKKLLSYLFPVLLMVACGGGITTLHAATITTHVTYQYSASGTAESGGYWPACSSTVTNTCIKGIKIYDVTTSTASVIGLMNNPPTPVGVQTWTQDFTDNTLTYGTHQATCDVDYIDSSGTEKETSQIAPVSFLYSAGSPTATIVFSLTAK